MKGFQKPVQMIAEEFRLAELRDVGESTILFFEFRSKGREVVSIGLSLPALMSFSVSAQHLFAKLAMLGEDVMQIREISGVEPTVFDIKAEQITLALSLVSKQCDIDLKDLFCEVLQAEHYFSAQDIEQSVGPVFEALAAAEAEQEGR